MSSQCERSLLACIVSVAFIKEVPYTTWSLSTVHKKQHSVN